MGFYYGCVTFDISMWRSSDHWELMRNVLMGIGLVVSGKVSLFLKEMCMKRWLHLFFWLLLSLGKKPVSHSWDLGIGWGHHLTMAEWRCRWVFKDIVESYWINQSWIWPFLLISYYVVHFIVYATLGWIFLLLAKIILTDKQVKFLCLANWINSICEELTEII